MRKWLDPGAEFLQRSAEVNWIVCQETSDSDCDVVEPVVQEWLGDEIDGLTNRYQL